MCTEVVQCTGGCFFRPVEAPGLRPTQQLLFDGSEFTHKACNWQLNQENHEDVRRLAAETRVLRYSWRALWAGGPGYKIPWAGPRGCHLTYDERKLCRLTVMIAIEVKTYEEARVRGLPLSYFCALNFLACVAQAYLHLGLNRWVTLASDLRTTNRVNVLVLGGSDRGRFVVRLSSSYN